ncbi:MAG: ACT domain-containing protein [Coleofasciculus sp. A1-SPW-01]|nr:ACT domain-containing protein [Coleofasciculus chthonoplastes]
MSKGKHQPQTATLLISCPDQPGLVAKFANFIYANGGNIIHADQHTDFDREHPVLDKALPKVTQWQGFQPHLKSQRAKLGCSPLTPGYFSPALSGS